MKTQFQNICPFDSHLDLMKFIIKDYGEYARQNLGLVPLCYIIKNLSSLPDYNEDKIQKFLIDLRITNRIELRMTKTQLAKNLNLELVNIRGVLYGFLKILDYSYEFD
jgi:hypothetical protein